MGFEEPTRTFRLIFEDPEFAGAEVVCKRRVSLRVYLDIAKDSEALQDVAALEAALRLFGDRVLAEWNVTVDGQPLPANGDGLISISPEFAMMILTAWLRAVSEVPAPLGEPSSAGNGSAAASIPMVTLSADPGS